ncbi:MAG: ABC transporter substrate-binding protein [Prolixibacteraceae bacterium]|nr:ABC transporter substrate-binding protein [Prolixibacteraceae bacterium]
MKKVNFLPSWVAQSQFAGYYMAKEKGIYEKYGMDVTIISGGYDKQVSEYLKEGKADFGTMYLTSAIKERADSINLVNIGQVFQQSGIMFVAKKESGIDRIEDFSGKKIAVWRTVLEEMTVGFLNKNHINADVIRINEGVNIFLKNAVDICVGMSYNEYNRLVNFGMNRDELSVFCLKDFEMGFPEDGIYCMEETIQEDPVLCENFVKASMEGWEYAFSHREETVQVLRKIQKQENISDNLTHLTWMLDGVQQLIKPAGEKNVDEGELLKTDYEKAVKFLLDEKVIDMETEFNNFYRGFVKNGQR